MPTDFIELARICIAHSHVTASPEVAAELRRIAEEYRKKAADLEWENWPSRAAQPGGIRGFPRRACKAAIRPARGPASGRRVGPLTRGGGCDL